MMLFSLQFKVVRPFHIMGAGRNAIVGRRQTALL